MFQRYKISAALVCWEWMELKAGTALQGSTQHLLMPCPEFTGLLADSRAAVVETGKSKCSELPETGLL